jgi:Family of unknown function (DUF5995)
MFTYDAQLAAVAQTAPQSIPGVLQVLQTIDATCVDGDGLKWFNWLYLQVTQAVENKVNAGGFNDPQWLAELDVEFAGLYFNALYTALTDAPYPGSWAAMFSRRDQADIARIQFALAGMNAHINHDLPYAIVATCRARNTAPQHGTPQYDDYTAVNATLDGLIDIAKKQLDVRLLGGTKQAGLNSDSRMTCMQRNGPCISLWRVAGPDPGISAPAPAASSGCGTCCRHTRKNRPLCVKTAASLGSTC